MAQHAQGWWGWRGYRISLLPSVRKRCTHCPEVWIGFCHLFVCEEKHGRLEGARKEQGKQKGSRREHDEV